MISDLDLDIIRSQVTRDTILFCRWKKVICQMIIMIVIIHITNIKLGDGRFIFKYIDKKYLCFLANL